MNTKTKFTELIKGLALFICTASIVLTLIIPIVANAQDIGEALGEIKKESQLPDFSNTHDSASYEAGASNITSGILYVVDLFKYLVATIAVVIIIASGVRLITAGKNIEEISDKMKDNIKYSLIGLIVIMTADFFVKQVFFGEEGEVVRSEADAQLAAERGTEMIMGIYNFLEYFVAAIAILMIVYAGVRMVTSGGNEEVIGKQKNQIKYAILGIMLVGVSEFLVKDIIFPDQGARLSDPNAAIKLTKDITNFVTGFIATVAIAMLMYGGVLYATAVNNDEQTEKAKTAIKGAIIGILIALGAFAIVNTIISFTPDTEENIQIEETRPDSNSPDLGSFEGTTFGGT